MATPDDLLDLPADITPRDRWAQWQTRRRLAKFYNYCPQRFLDSLPEKTLPLLPELKPDIKPHNLPTLPEFHPTKSLPDEIKVCIVGAGAAGLFTAMMFDWLKEKSKDGKIPELNISYDIYEAAEKDRLGGRLYTYNFPSTTEHPVEPGEHQYYDVGAMRFPKNPIMRRTFDLFEKVGIHERSKHHPHGKLIPYYLKGENNPSYYNDIYYSKPPPDTIPDPYNMNSQKGAPIPDEYLKQGPDKTINDAIDVYRNAFAKNPVKGWHMLMDADKFTARDFLQLPPLSNFKTVNHVTAADGSGDNNGENEVENPIGGPGFNFNTVEWLETFNGGTRWYSQAFSEMVLENLDFDYPEEKTPWYCIDGGANVLAQEMEKKISQKPNYGSAITCIKLEKSDIKREKGGIKLENVGIKLEKGGMKLEKGGMKLENVGFKLEKGEDIHNVKVEIENVKGQKEQKSYAAVLSSTTLGAMQRMDLTGAKLNLGTKQAIRTLNYGASCKVGIRFSKAWWILCPLEIKGGQGKTDLPIRTCVYPSYNIGDDHEKPAVLLCSYTWEQDASRMGSLISKDSPKDEDALKKLLFRNLALLHSTSATYTKVYNMIKDSYITHHAYDWYKDPNSVGAFAFFGASQFKEVWPDITNPSADGKLIIIGEAASTHHAWVVGALESAVRGVFQFIERYAVDYPEYRLAAKYLESLKLEPEDAPDNKPDPDNKYERPFGPLPYSFDTKVARHQVVVSMARAEGSLN